MEALATPAELHKAAAPSARMDMVREATGAVREQTERLVRAATHRFGKEGSATTMAPAESSCVIS